jgi:putative ABC transport system permease protein
MKSLRLAFRTLRKTPFVTGVAVLSLALGIGANAAIFSLFDGMLLRSLPASEPDRLVNFGTTGMNWGSTSCSQAGSCDDIFSYPMFRDLQQADGPFSGIAAHRSFGANLSSQGSTTSASGMLVSGSYFPILGVRPALGRLFGPDDDRDIGANFVAVLSHDYWQADLGGDPAVLNKSIIINGKSMTIVGVAAAGFTGTTLGVLPDVYVPISMRSEVETFFDAFENRRSYWVYTFGRLAPEVSMEAAEVQINTTFSGIVNEVEAPLQEGMSEQTLARFRAKQIMLSPGFRGQSSIHEEVQTPLRLLMAITGVVLLIACANIANLLLARAAARAQEMAVRGSLGAGRGVLIRQLLTESMMLAVMGGVASLLVAKWTIDAIMTVLPAESVEQLNLGISWTVVLFSGALAVGTGVLFGLYPALDATRQDLVSMLKAGGGQPSARRSAIRFRNGLVTSQIALSMTLLVAAGLFIKSLSNVTRVDLGLDSSNVFTFGVSPALNGYENEDSQALFVRAEETLAALPGVTGVTAALVPLIGGSSWGNGVNVEDFENGPDIDNNSRFNEIGPGYFSSLGIPLLAGREFTDSDVRDGPKVAIVNEAFVEKFGLPGRDAVGKRMSGGGEELDIEIVGVVQNAKYSAVKDDIPPVFYLPYRQVSTLGWINFYVRSSLPPAQTMPQINATIAGLDPNLPVEDLKTLDDQIKENIVLDRMISTLSAAFALLATLLAGVGLYGVLAYTVTQRTREIGVRMALGAPTGSVRSMVLRQVGRMAIIGGLVGIVAALALGRLAASLLFRMDAADPGVVVAVSIVLALVTLAAGYLPARRASKIDPILALRYE